MITLFKVTAEDEMFLFALRNMPEVYKMYTNNRSVTPIEHKAWFGRLLERSDVLLLIAWSEQSKIGYVRYDITEKTATVSIALHPEYQNRGMGSELLQRAEAWVVDEKKIECIQAEIKVFNQASRRLFEKNGFEIDSFHLKKKLKCNWV